MAAAQTLALAPEPDPAQAMRWARSEVFYLALSFALRRASQGAAAGTTRPCQSTSASAKPS